MPDPTKPPDHEVDRVMAEANKLDDANQAAAVAELKNKLEGMGEPHPRHERMLEWFKYAHLPARLQKASKPFCDLAVAIVDEIKPGPERTVVLRKLLEAKDAAVRATLVPGG